MHCITVSLAQDGMGLGAMWGKEKALEMLGETGFGQVDVRQLGHDIQNDYYIVQNGLIGLVLINGSRSWRSAQMC